MLKSLLPLLTALLLFDEIEALPNFVFVLTDDQDLTLNSLTPMTKTLNLIANHGMSFTNAFVNSPICCPSRSTILTGQFAHNLKVYNNSLSGGCSSVHFQSNFENATIAAHLKRDKNYKTFYAGKYLNQYQNTSHVPPGYDWWIGLKGNSKYYNYTLSINGTRRFFADDYLTDKIGEYALDFLNVAVNVSRDNFFIMLAPPAAHAPFIPAERHANEFPAIRALRVPPFNYTPVRKHWLVEMPPQSLPSNVSTLDGIYGNRWRTLLAVDELIESIVLKLKQLNVLQQTYIIFMSDNGYHIGQFCQPWDKRQPYESDIRVPLLVRGPGIPEKSSAGFPVSAVDMAATVLDLAGIKTRTDGKSFKNVLFDPGKRGVYNKKILIEYWGEGNSKSVDPECPWKQDDSLAGCSVESWCKCQDSRNNTYACVIEMSNVKRFKYCKFKGGFVEAYDLTSDPLELTNVHKDMAKGAVKHYEKQLQVLQGR